MSLGEGSPYERPRSPLSERPRIFSQVDRASSTLDRHQAQTQPPHPQPQQQQRLESSPLSPAGGLALTPSPLLSVLYQRSPVIPASTSIPRMDVLAAVTSRSPFVSSPLVDVPGSALGWQPTRLTSPFRVLSAAGVLEDFYTSGLSWGRDRMALALRHDLLLFHPTQPKLPSARAVLTGGDGKDTTNKLPSAVAMSRQADTSCFVGFADGSVSLFESTESGQLASTTTFSLPEPPLTGYERQLTALSQASKPLTTSETTSVRRLSSILSRARTAFTSVGAFATCELTPWSVAVGTASCGLLTLDARGPQRPSVVFGSAPTSSFCSVTSGGATSLAHLQGRITETLQRNERICGVSWNASGSLLAVGTGNGVVRVWSLSQPNTPIHSFVVRRDATVKALCFHPTNPYELLAGTDAGEHGLCVYDLSTAAPALVWSTRTTAQTVQALYSPDGEHLVTSHGTVITNGAANDRQSPRLGGGAAGGGSSPSSSVGLAHQRYHDLGLVYSAVDAPHVAAYPAATAATSLAGHGFSDHDEGDQGDISDDDASGGSGLGSEGRGNSPRSLSSFCLAVWRKSCPLHHHSQEALQQAFFSTGVPSPPPPPPMASEQGSNGNVGGTLARADGVRTGGPHPPSLRLLYTLPGHRSRPIHLTTPFYPTSGPSAPSTLTSRSGSSQTNSSATGRSATPSGTPSYAEVLGAVASEAGGGDDTIRFWRVFQQEQRSGRAAFSSRAEEFSSRRSIRGLRTSMQEMYGSLDADVPLR